MGNNEIREPIQKRSIKKKEKIIEAGFSLICEKGYYNTNTVEIAKQAGVSTGIVYSYFQDKHDILIEGIKKYAVSIFHPTFALLTEDISLKKENIDKVLRKLISDSIENHKISELAHQELMAMAHSDEEVAEIFNQAEINLTSKITNFFLNNNFPKENLMEKIHISIGLIDNLCHEVVYHKHKNLNYETMINVVIDTIINLLDN